MKMLIKIAWRNVWRSKLRSLLVMIAVALGLWAGAFMMSFSYGMNMQRMRDILQTKLSHIQLHVPKFRDEMESKMLIPNANATLAALSKDPKVKAATGRAIVTGMMQTTKGAYGVQINGILPESEANVTQLKERLVAGKYLDGKKSNMVLLGEKLMEEIGWKTGNDSTGYEYKLRKKLTVAFLGSNGETNYQLFRVGGVFKSSDKRFERSNIYVLNEDLAEALGGGQPMHEIALLLNDRDVSEDTTYLQSIQAAYPDLAVENWKDLAPDLRFMDESFGATLMVFMVIILLALLFGIVNTMLMAILDRTRELGMLMSIGMNRFKVFTMVMLETIFLTLAGTPVGLLVAYATTTYFGKVGIDISSFGDSLGEFGMSSIVYTDLESGYYLDIAIMVVVTSLIAAIFPARRALRLNPAEAVRAL